MRRFELYSIIISIVVLLGTCGWQAVSCYNNVNTAVTAGTYSAPIVIFNAQGQATSAVSTGTINIQTGTSYSLQTTDNRNIVTLNNSGNIIQLGAGQATFTASGTTITSRQSFTKTAGEGAICYLIATSANTFVMGGNASN